MYDPHRKNVRARVVALGASAHARRRPRSPSRLNARFAFTEVSKAASARDSADVPIGAQRAGGVYDADAAAPGGASAAAFVPSQGFPLP